MTTTDTGAFHVLTGPVVDTGRPRRRPLPRRHTALAFVLVLALIVAAGTMWALSGRTERVTVDDASVGGSTLSASVGMPAAVTQPRIGTISDASYLMPQEPVVVLGSGQQARAYPVRYLLWHDVINDVVANIPVAVTFGPLTGTAAAFVRPVIKGGPAVMTASGLLNDASLVLTDTATGSTWPQLVGSASTGPLKGTRLAPVPVSVVPWGDYVAAFPAGSVMLPPNGARLPYQQTPYPGYDRMSEAPSQYKDAVDVRLAPMTRVLGVAVDGTQVAFPYGDLRAIARARITAVNVVVGNHPVLITWRAGARSMMDSFGISASRDVGAANAFSAVLDGQQLTFEVSDRQLTDTQTHSVWNSFGAATAGPLKGRVLSQLDATPSFWFSWAHRYPATTVWKWATT